MARFSLQGGKLVEEAEVDAELQTDGIPSLKLISGRNFEVSRHRYRS